MKVSAVGNGDERWSPAGVQRGSLQPRGRSVRLEPVMRNLLILFATAASLLLGACGSDVEEPADTPHEMIEEHADTPHEMVEESSENSISAVRLADRIQAGSAPLILDTRSREEYARRHIPGAINIPLDELPTRMTELPIAKSEEVIVVPARRGAFARRAEETLRGSGYSNVRHLAGYMKEWQAAKLPTE